MKNSVTDTILSHASPQERYISSGRMPKPYNLTRLTFETHEAALCYHRENAVLMGQTWLWHEALGNQAEPIALTGVCDIFDRGTKFSGRSTRLAAPERFLHGIHWWYDLFCSCCGLSSIERAVFRVILDDTEQGGRLYHVGDHSGFRRFLSAKLPDVTSSQYEEGRAPGEVEDDVRYEDLTNLSFASGSFDTIVCMEVLEHIPDFKASLREMARVLAPGGEAILTFPWLGGEHYDHLVRAEMRPDGSINHFLPPELHGDSARGEGILSFRSFGWSILDELREAGFSRARATFIFGPLHGYMTFLTPIFIATR